MNRQRGIGLALVAIGLVMNQYGFLHDLVLQKHGGAIYMGPRSFAAVLIGLVMAVAGIRMIWRSNEK